MTGPFTLGSEVEPGCYICLRTRSLFGALVRAWTGSQYDHAILVTAPGECIQATLRGVKTGPLSQFRGCLACANTAEEMTGLQRVTVVKAAERYDGDEYAFAAIIVIGLRKLGLKWGWLLRASADKGAVFCSELAVLAGQAGGKDWLCGRGTPALVAPGDLAVRPGMRRTTLT